MSETARRCTKTIEEVHPCTKATWTEWLYSAEAEISFLSKTSMKALTRDMEVAFPEIQFLDIMEFLLQPRIALVISYNCESFGVRTGWNMFIHERKLCAWRIIAYFEPVAVIVSFECMGFSQAMNVNWVRIT